MNDRSIPWCTRGEAVGFLIIAVLTVFGLTSVDPEWLHWAAPIAFGGALVASDPPTTNFFAPMDWQEVIPIAFAMGGLALLSLWAANRPKPPEP